LIVTTLPIGVALWAALHPHPVRAPSPGLTGSYGFSINVPYAGNAATGPGVIQGVVTLDGAGNATGSGVFTAGPDPDPNATAPQVRPRYLTLEPTP
jgi:hypothetical protein